MWLKLILWIAPLYWYCQVQSSASASQAGLFVTLKLGAHRQIEYSINSKICSDKEFVKLAEAIMKQEPTIRPVVLFDDRLSIADVGNVGGLLGAVGFTMPRYFMFSERRTRVVEINLAEPVAVFDYGQFVKDPYGTIEREHK
jgi:hypothetical protein